ncbi:aminomethyl-transferring glycine dehydrogenase [Actinomadura bangladeshensis]|uniref:Glycine dehydrogenase (decarboxylating) n=1 Tax=Actinomadura bangladeshensis TaxID=453573 RepID=A0A4V2XLG6_9ACTN|nr:aminomethyl-transferring glycine dehydrogenase [Actinomadura bangladeshensis]TDC10186.1 glycine dehydrogenase (aminomethyl-transferring) [Actinomadura bangladeshensis]
MTAQFFAPVAAPQHPRSAFADRHIGPGPDEQARMLAAIGYSGAEALIDAAVPAAIRTARPLGLPPALSETAALDRLRELASRNTVLTSMIGLGYHGTTTPGVIMRNVLENPGWYTAYTPYQPEISQGRLEALLNFQTVVADLTGLPVANASMLDEGTAAAEGMALAHRVSRRREPGTFLVDADTLPQTIEVVRTRAVPLGIEVVTADLSGGLPDGDFFGVLLQYPGASGAVRDLAPVIAQAHERGAKAVVAADLLALTLLRPPGESGADIAVGSAQRFGVPYGFGGPHAGYMAVGEGIQRQLPGRLVGVSVDADGATAYRLALQTREQHIRREKATSNICTAQVLLAVMASMYAVYHGPEGLAAIAQRAHRRAAEIAAGLRAAGVEVVHGAFFDTVLARVPGRAAEVVAAARERGINLRPDGPDRVGIACDETTLPEHVTAVLEAFGAAPAESAAEAIPDALRRESPYLTHPVFHAHRSETAMLRYLRRLQDKDVALDRSMIPLGSCTMKLNATAEMEPITWPEFANVHPFAPIDQAAGYVELIGELEDALAEITGYARVSVQPNAGSQGELAGLLAIRGYHASRGEEHRDVCLIPSSAHGTNAASAVMAGMRVVVVACDERGNVALDDLHAKIGEHRDRLAAIMVTYPSTHGVFEETITDVCAAVHEAGGQVYVDGANLNALVGLARPGEFGSDVSHLNLHKTFCIPHGGGGPGVGPIGVREHLAPFLPNHPLRAEAGAPSGASPLDGGGWGLEDGPDTGVGPVSAAPWGSAGILPISWAYIAMMGPDGLRAATEGAIIGANYLAARLAPHYPILYTGRNGLVAHECIADLRKITKETGITAEDVAKRLIDYGFHAPTLSFPVAGTLMIEPTESEDLAELDRFCDAMIEIRREIQRVADGGYDREDNPLKNAPHTAACLISDDWKHAYTRDEAAYPLPSLREDKYWPPVRRIDQAYGDRNLVCSCPPPEAFED